MIPQADNTQQCVSDHMRRPIKGSTEGTEGGAWCRVIVTRVYASGRSGARSQGGIAAKHGHARTVLRATKGDHVLANVTSNKITMMTGSVGQDVLDEVIAKLVTSDFVKD